MTVDTVLSSEILIRENEQLRKRKMELSARSKTSKLWLNYQNMLKVARPIVIADRTDSWLMHVRAVSECIQSHSVRGFTSDLTKQKLA